MAAQLSVLLPLEYTSVEVVRLQLLVLAVGLSQLVDT